MSLENIKDILVARVNSFDSGKHDVMTEAKLVITTYIKAEVRVLSYKNDILRIATEDSSAASEIRLRSNDLLKEINQKVKPATVKRLYVSVR